MTVKVTVETSKSGSDQGEELYSVEVGLHIVVNSLKYLKYIYKTNPSTMVTSNHNGPLCYYPFIVVNEMAIMAIISLNNVLIVAAIHNIVDIIVFTIGHIGSI